MNPHGAGARGKQGSGDADIFSQLLGKSRIECREALRKVGDEAVSDRKEYLPDRTNRLSVYGINVVGVLCCQDGGRF